MNISVVLEQFVAAGYLYLLDFKANFMLEAFLVTLFSPFGGVTVVLIGLTSFLGKIWIDKTILTYKELSDEKINNLQSELQITSQKLQTELDKGLHTHKIQFEKEFVIYGEVWEQLISVKKKVLALRPTMDMVVINESQEERNQRRLKELSEVYNPFYVLVEKYRPFYPQEVYDALMALIHEIRDESVDFEFTERKRAEYFKEARENQDRIIMNIEKVCVSIRSRLSGVEVSEI